MPTRKIHQGSARFSLYDCGCRIRAVTNQPRSTSGKLRKRRSRRTICSASCARRTLLPTPFFYRIVVRHKKPPGQEPGGCLFSVVSVNAISGAWTSVRQGASNSASLCLPGIRNRSRAAGVARPSRRPRVRKAARDPSLFLDVREGIIRPVPYRRPSFEGARPRRSKHTLRRGR
jgi:hypothetical protein